MPGLAAFVSYINASSVLSEGSSFGQFAFLFMTIKLCISGVSIKIIYIY
ncbi:hypothetical protein L581_3509 [Serratia fonticola AU-AP2C]|nr:hypothetical protein L581_3509 [Serratia fonticola AU-AP2C]